MSERTEYAPGTPSWVDLSSPDPTASAAFYGQLFGWQANFDMGGDAGGYGLFTVRGLNVAGVGPKMRPDMPTIWTLYITVEDVDKTLEVATRAGGTIIVGAMDVMGAGRMGVIQDTMGCFVSVWQPKASIGAQLVNEYGTFTWCELGATDIAEAREFYTTVFGWGIQDNTGDQGTIFTVDGKVICGAHPAAPGEFPAWSIWFSVEDCDKSAALVSELGGKIFMPPTNMDFGRGSVVADPQGAVFGLGAVSDSLLPNP